MKAQDQKKNDKSLKVAIAGGGTGGHLFPAISMAEAFRQKDPKTGALFISSGNRFEVETLGRAGFSLEKVIAQGIKGKGIFSQGNAMIKMPFGIFQSALILKRFNPDVVIGVGGYSSGPVAAAAKLMGIKTALHEQNILPGITNSFLSLFADRVYVSFDETRLDAAGRRIPSINPKKVVVTGNPIRKELLEQGRKISKQNFLFHILVLGGSQGAHKINLAIIEALNFFRARDLFFIHQTGEKDAKRVEKAYKKHEISHEVKPFFNDMGKRYARADLVICRSGAGAVAEISALGKSAVFVPFPFAADNHQLLNAMTMKKKGAADIINEDDLTGRRLYETVRYYRSNRDALSRMAEKAGKMGKPGAAEAIVRDCYQLLERDY